MTRPSANYILPSRLLAVVLAVGIIPIPLPVGTLYGLEVIVALFAARLVVSRPIQSWRLSPATLVCVVLASVLTVQLAIGLSGEASSAVYFTRAVWFFAAALLVLDNSPRFASAAVQAIPIAVVVALAVLAWEQITGLSPIAGESIGALSADQARLIGPLGPGPTASLMLVGAAYGLTRRSLMWATLSVGGLLLTGSRAQLVGLGVLLCCLVLTKKLPLRIALLGGTAAFVVSLVLMPDALHRLSDMEFGSGVRFELWQTAWDRLSDGYWFTGVGPAGLSIGEDGGSLTNTFPHNQYLAIPLFAGVVGMIALAIALWDFVRRSSVADQVPFALSMLATAVFGEFVVPVLLPTAVAAVFVWALVTRGAERESPGLCDVTGLAAHQGSCVPAGRYEAVFRRDVAARPVRRQFGEAK